MREKGLKDERRSAGRAHKTNNTFPRKDNHTIPCLCTCLHILSENKFHYWEIRRELAEQTYKNLLKKKNTSTERQSSFRHESRLPYKRPNGRFFFLDFHGKSSCRRRFQPLIHTQHRSAMSPNWNSVTSTIFVTKKQNEPKRDQVHTSRIVSVCDIIWMLTWDWLVGRLSVERDLARDREPVRTFLLLRAISVRRNTLDMYAELSPRIRKAVRRNFAGVTCELTN